MSNASEGFANAMADVTNQVQADAAAAQPQRTGETTPPAAAPTPTPQADPAIGATSTPLIDGKWKTEEERVRAHHLLIANLNAVKKENDLLKAEKAAAVQAPAPTPLSPGRVDPAADDEKWRTGYGIDPADLDARIEARVQARLEAERAPSRAMQAAEAYINQTYPDFALKVEDIKAFVNANEVVNARVQGLYNQGLFAEAMEIGYLAYDNALRTFNIAAAENANTQAEITASRQAGTMISSQAGGPREATKSPNSFPTTAEDWTEIARMKAAGQDAAVRQRLFGHMIAGIPALNGGQQR